MFSKKKKTKQDDTLDILQADTELSAENALPDENDFPGETDFPDETAGLKKPKKKLPGWVIIPIIIVVLTGAYGISLLAGGTDGSNQTAAVLETTKAVKGDVKEVYNASGTIESENTKTYYSPVTAPIKECRAVVGQPVKKGDFLISFDTKNLERDNKQAQLNLQSSLNTSRAAKAKNAQAIEAANAANAQAADQANALADEVNALAEQVNAAKAQYDANLQETGVQAQAIQKQKEQLQQTIAENQAIVTANQSIIDSTDSGYAGKRAELDAALNVPEDKRTEEQKATIANLQPVFDAYDAAVSARDAAQAAADSAASELNSLTEPDVDDAGYAELQAKYEAKYAEWQAAYQAANASPSADTGMTDADLANLDISDNLAELSALTPEELLEKGKEGMKADMDGVIASVAADTLQSNSATQGLALFTIASTEKTRVTIEISPDDYAKMKTGTPATITVGGSTYEGALTNVDKIAVKNEKGTPVIGAQIHINNPDENICIGATAKIKMTVAESKDVLVVPTEAVNASADGDFVYVIEDGVVKEKPVTLGTASTTQVEIRDGLKEGDLVVNDLNVDIREGMKAVAKESSDEP